MPQAGEQAKPWKPVRISSSGKPTHPLALGCWAFGGAAWGGQNDEDSRAVMDAALDAGLNHFDTAIAYGGGKSEQVVGEFLRERGVTDKVYLASKSPMRDMTADKARGDVERSLNNLGLDHVDLYYIHWPHSEKDMRPAMEELERLRGQGRIGAIGVSNFNVQQMRQVAEVGTIDAHQMCYNLFWRLPEPEVMPYCQEHGITVVTYSSIAQGILTGKYPRHPQFPEGDQRPKTVPFRENVWPHLYEATEELKPLAQQVGRPLAHLAIRWVLQRQPVDSVLVGARNPDQLRENVAALDGEIPQEVFDQMTAISDQAISHLPEDASNIFGITR